MGEPACIHHYHQHLLFRGFDDRWTHVMIDIICRPLLRMNVSGPRASRSGPPTIRNARRSTNSWSGREAHLSKRAAPKAKTPDLIVKGGSISRLSAFRNIEMAYCKAVFRIETICDASARPARPDMIFRVSIN